MLRLGILNKKECRVEALEQNDTHVNSYSPTELHFSPLLYLHQSYIRLLMETAVQSVSLSVSLSVLAAFFFSIHAGKGEKNK